MKSTTKKQRRRKVITFSKVEGRLFTKDLAFRDLASKLTLPSNIEKFSGQSANQFATVVDIICGLRRYCDEKLLSWEAALLVADENCFYAARDD